MPKCDTCGFAHAQPDRCINCGNTDPFRRHRITKFVATIVSVLLICVFAIYFYQRYNQIELLIREAGVSNPKDAVSPVPVTTWRSDTTGGGEAAP